MDVFNLKTDPKLEVNGTWKDLGDGSKLLVARFGNKPFAKECDRLRSDNAGALKKDEDAAEDLWETLRIGAMAKYILLGWEGITYKREPVEYSVEKATEFLAISDFRKIVEAIAIDIDNFRVQEEATQTGN